MDGWMDGQKIHGWNEGNDVHSFGKTDRSVTNEKRYLRTSCVYKNPKSQPFQDKENERKKETEKGGDTFSTHQLKPKAELRNHQFHI